MFSKRVRCRLDCKERVSGGESDTGPFTTANRAPTHTRRPVRGLEERIQEVQAVDRDTLAGALGLGTQEVVSLVGAGGKTTALHRLGEELAVGDNRVVAATTTAMFLSQMRDFGPVLMEAEGGELGPRLRKALLSGRTASVAQSVGDRGKVVGIPTLAIDELWSEGLADYLLVEADGSRGLPFKAFGPHEPQVPAVTTTVVDMVGLDALGTVLDEEHVHRAQLLAAMLGIPLGGVVTGRVLADGINMQLAQLRQTCRNARIVLLLNKADGPRGRAAGLEVVRLLEDKSPAQERPSEIGRCARAGKGRADSVVVASLHEHRCTLVTTGG